VAVLINPTLEIQWLKPAHLVSSGIVAMHLSSMAMGVGKQFTSTVVRQGCVSAKYSAHSRL
jgi:hypothetical protein